MKVIIKGDSIPAHIAAAHNAVERHKEIYGVSHLYHEEIYDVKYRGKRYQIEVTTNKASYIANVLAAANGVGFEGYIGEQDYCCYGHGDAYDDENPLRAAMVVFLQMEK